MNRRPMLLIAVPLLMASVSFGRLHRSWSYEDLQRESDLVVLATATNSVDSGEIDTNTWEGVTFIGVNTGFQVSLVLKGSTNQQSITVFHLRHQPELLNKMRNGAMLVKFITEPLRKHSAKPDYLLFLKRRPDGRYEPTSGHIDPIDSVRRMDGAIENYEGFVGTEIEKTREAEPQQRRP